MRDGGNNFHLSPNIFQQKFYAVLIPVPGHPLRLERPGLAAEPAGGGGRQRVADQLGLRLPLHAGQPCARHRDLGQRLGREDAALREVHDAGRVRGRRHRQDVLGSQARIWARPRISKKVFCRIANSHTYYFD